MLNLGRLYRVFLIQFFQLFYLYEHLYNKNLEERGNNSERRVLTYLVTNVLFLIEKKKK